MHLHFAVVNAPAVTADWWLKQLSIGLSCGRPDSNPKAGPTLRVLIITEEKVLPL